MNYQSIIHLLLMIIKFQKYFAMNTVEIKGKKSNYKNDEPINLKTK